LKVIELGKLSRIDISSRFRQLLIELFRIMDIIDHAFIGIQVEVGYLFGHTWAIFNDETAMNLEYFFPEERHVQWIA